MTFTPSRLTAACAFIPTPANGKHGKARSALSPSLPERRVEKLLGVHTGFTVKSNNAAQGITWS